MAVTGIAAVTLNAAPFGNSGQFSLSGNSLVIDPGKITQPAVGVTDTYVVTVNNLGGGTTLVTILVSHGSVKIDSINITNGDATAPTTTAAPSVSGITGTGTTLSATINENGTGYYLVQAAAAAAPTVAAVQAGTSFAMTANVEATPAISGLTASTAYTVYFVAKDTANNVQAAVQSVNVTTTAAPDVTAPTTSAGPSVSGTTDTATTLSATINENGTGYYLVQAAAAAAPTVAAVQAGTSFAMTAGVAASPAISGLTASTAYTVYFVAKDAANNVQAAVQSVAVTTNTAPTANNFTYGTNIDNTAKTFDWKVLSAAADADGDPLTATVQAQGAKGAFVVAGNNVTYTPSANQTVSDSGTLRISDGRGGTKDITVTVNGIDTQAPAAPTGLALNNGAATTSTAANGSLVTTDGLSDPPDSNFWFVSETGSAPAAGDAGWSGTRPTTYTFATATNETKTVCVYVKDNSGNVQPTGACDTINKVP